MNQVILYYNFQTIENVPKFYADQRRKCKALNLLGRIYVAEEGINGTLAGRKEDVEAYKQHLNAQPGFENTEYKDDSCDFIPFVKLVVKIRPEIVALKPKTKINLAQERGKHISPRQWRQILESGEDITLLDVRNQYESKIGHFEGAVVPDVENFYNFEDWLDQTPLDRDKKVLMYCTGGIRCEKFSVLMEKKGFKEVYQLHGGILNYKNKEGGAHFRGKCFVFDDRLSVPMREKEEVISFCEIIGVPCDQYLNCANPDCNKLFICSPEGAKKYEGCCSSQCYQAKRRRPFDPENIYEPTRKWHTYFA
ncbi:MAG TPA: rhodanese-related sulfurtransferase [Candidatus Omnitrophota bacterium]|nr:rhodanese-related sulfurtransferase [Candidatus Omnitrophota bacterium]